MIFLFIYIVCVILQIGNSSILCRKRQTYGGPETSTSNDQTNTYTNEAFEIEENQQADEISSQFRLFDRPQDDGGRTRNDD